ncbi:Alcohol dehydrogenase, zinc-binding domain protein [Candidatus Promineifilum breve]|uniref:Alcohol dehydrogenase, zinc-binding domain protein n=1 Tax=Candidatus Promineifilum breve TaxID=1806508 RepID=A0A160T453_9CHLR|nr:zinc-dependent alcohol dehydrogenase family protein [Candidatus Promineifilum breve]CUS04614.2 Alcohol dehydrogenase, zinc-binding domain protein [Candidatus Promineifilum breve]
MRAIRFSRFGPPAEVLSLEELPLPEPGPGQVRLRLTHRSINPSDLLTVSGEYGRLPRLPATPGFEAVGRVEALGEGVRGLPIGTRVVPLGVGGTWAESATAAAALLLPVPEAVSDAAAAQFVVNPVTAWVMLVEELQLEPGDWVVQTAAGSTLGRLVIQLGRLRGYRTINLVRRPEQVDELLALGADAVYCTGDEDVVERVREVTGGRGAKGALEAVGGRTGEIALKTLRPGGTMLVYGMLGGEPLPLHNGEMLFRGLTVRGFWLSQWFRQTDPAHVTATLGTLMQLMADGHLLPPVEAEYDLADFQTAIAHCERPGRQGKVLLTG